ncbi:MAG: arylsulfatase [Bacteroidetes bacterium RBG_13_43_22]|nr:MAG: arylsulfatase [Bacteroidetes bacterium RBG_13_43_22]
MKKLFILFLVIAGFACSSDKMDQQLPNIVIILADDMGYGDVSFLNVESKIPTPNLNQLAQEGMYFTDGHSSSGICSPSRYSLITGCYHWRKFHDIVQSFGPSVFDPEELTLPEMLKEKGYRTACIGKWHLGWDWEEIKKPGAQTQSIEINGAIREIFGPEAFDWSKHIPGGPISNGFDYYFGDDVINFPPYTWIENDSILIEPTELYLNGLEDTQEGKWECRPGPTVKDWDYYQVLPTIVRKAVSWIDQQKNSRQPFFLYFPLSAPHAPIIPNEGFRGKSQAGGYGDFVVEVDWIVGQILNVLERNSFAENTLLVFTSDNGPERYAYERLQKYQHNSSGPLRGLKRDIWEGGHRVPFIIRWPGMVEPGKISNEIINQTDIFATIAEIIDYNLPASAAPDSYSFLSHWKGDPKARNIREAMVHNTFEDKYAIRKGKWVLINAPDGTHSDVPGWINEMFGYEPNYYPAALFDLTIDLRQQKNLYMEHPEIVKELQDLLKKYQEEGRSVIR